MVDARDWEVGCGDGDLVFNGDRVSVQETKIMASRPITSWQIDGETVDTVADFILGGSKIIQMVTAAMKLKDACSLEEKL